MSRNGMGQSNPFWAELFLNGSLWPPVIFSKSVMGNSGTKRWPWISKDLRGTWVCLDAIESLQKTWTEGGLDPWQPRARPTPWKQHQCKTTTLAEAASPEHWGRQIWSTSLCSQCNAVKPLALLPVHISANWKDCPNANVISALIWNRSVKTYSGLEFDNFERQGKTISSHWSRALFISLCQI